MSKPIFTKEQIKWIEKQLTPYCCHISGTHNPKHFTDNPSNICDNQKTKAYERICKSLNLNITKAIPDPNCGWCNDTEAELKKLKGKKKLDNFDILNKYLKSIKTFLSRPERSKPKYFIDWGYLMVRYLRGGCMGKSIITFELKNLPKYRLRFKKNFSTKDIKTIKEHVEKVFSIFSSWNGVGCNTFSIAVHKK